MKDELTCSEAGEHLDAYLDRALPPMLRQGMETHLSRCPACTRTLDEHRCTRRLLRQLPRESMPARMKHHLLDVLRSMRSPEN